MRYIREQVVGDLAPEPDAHMRAQAAQVRRVLSALDPVGLAAIQGNGLRDHSP